MDQTTIAKGESILKGRPILVVPLFVETDDSLLDLPHFALTNEVRLHLGSSLSWIPTAVQDYIHQLLTSQQLESRSETKIATYIVITALCLLFSDADDAQTLVKDADAANHAVDVFREDYDVSIARKTWESLSDEIKYSWEKWLNVIVSVSTRFALVQLMHPAFEYAQSTLPHLAGGSAEKDGDLTKAAKLLHVNSSQSVLCMMKEIQQQSSPRPWAVICDDDISEYMVQDCFPVADLLLSSKGTDNNFDESDEISLVANYDTSRGLLQFGVDRLQCRGDVLEDRIRKMKAVWLPNTCVCDRCRYEMSTQCDSGKSNVEREAEPWVNEISVERRLRLAHGYMALGDIGQARMIYEKIKDEAEECWMAERADAWHALGAIKLSRGHFLAAQRLWRDAKTVLASTHSAQQPHAGLDLQWEKLRCYGYLAPNSSSEVEGVPSFRTILSKVFVSQVLSLELCDRVFGWANTGVWTKKRHYAVPTCDVPVHEVEPLLAWFNEFMSNTIRPLLARQFETSPDYFVHDAFVVKYSADEKSNHLPLHTDESTHSLVIALNDEYEGGGTYFSEQDTVVRLRKGEVLSFRGDSMSHGGEALRSGHRFIIAAFLYHDNDSSADGKRETSWSRKRALSGTNSGSDRLSKEAKESFAFNFQLTH